MSARNAHTKVRQEITLDQAYLIGADDSAVGLGKMFEVGLGDLGEDIIEIWENDPANLNVKVTVCITRPYEPVKTTTTEIR